MVREEGKDGELQFYPLVPHMNRVILGGTLIRNNTIARRVRGGKGRARRKRRKERREGREGGREGGEGGREGREGGRGVREGGREV